MGGHAAGEMASRVAADTIEAFIQQTEGVDAPTSPGPSATSRDWASTATASCRRCCWPTARSHQRVDRRPGAARDGDDGGVRCCCRPSAGAASEGDAATPEPRLRARLARTSRPSSPTSATRRAYLWRDGDLDQLTRDHSWVEEQIALGRAERRRGAAAPVAQPRDARPGRRRRPAGRAHAASALEPGDRVAPVQRRPDLAAHRRGDRARSSPARRRASSTSSARPSSTPPTPPAARTTSR